MLTVRAYLGGVVQGRAVVHDRTGGKKTEHNRSFDALLKRYNVDSRRPNVGLQLLEEREYTRLIPEQTRIGVSGTWNPQGRVRDPNPEYRSGRVRGTGGNFGLYQDYVASESQLYDAAFSITELMKSGIPRVKMPSVVRKSQRGALENFVQAQDRALRHMTCVDGGWNRFVHEAGSAVWAGFSVFERFHRYHPSCGWILTRLEPRLQNTVEEWIEDSELDTLIASRHRSVHEGYTLPRWAPQRAQQLNRMLLVRVGGYGHDWEGDPPTRPALHWVQFKRLIATLAPAVAEVWGAPRTFVKRDIEYLKAAAEGAVTSNPSSVEDLYYLMLDSLAEDVPFYLVPDGAAVELLSASGTMPDLMAWIQYCDQMMSSTFSTEGSLLGMQHATGSYAQAEVYERRFLRSAPYYQQILSDALTEQIIRPLAEQHCGPLIEAPRVEIESIATIDADRWLENARSLFGPNVPMTEWPENFQKIAYRLMKVDPPQALREVEEHEMPWVDGVASNVLYLSSSWPTPPNNSAYREAA